jgi:hypothetical protein
MPVVPVAPPALPRLRAVTMAVVVVMLFAAGSCGSDGSSGTDAVGRGGQASEQVEQAESTVAGGAPSGQSGTHPPQRTVQRVPGGPAPAGDGGSSGGGSGGEDGDAVDPVALAARQGPGDFAAALLRPTPRGAKRIVYQVMVQSGAAPATNTVDHVVAMLRRVSGKNVDVQTVTLPAGSDTWSSTELHALADRYSQTRSSVDVAVLNVLFVRGSHEAGENVLGVASRGDVLSMFPDQYRSLGAGLSPQAIEASVVMHETGHILGLVGHVVRPQRQDPDHPGHSPNKASVMYWAVETDDIISAFVGAPPKEFDADDLADLELIRNG